MIITPEEKIDIGFDLDSILNNLPQEWLRAYNKDYNDSLQVSQLSRWEMHHFVKPECGEKIYDYIMLPNWFRNLDVLPGAQEATKWVVESGMFNVFIVTAYKVSTCVDKADFIQRFYPWIDVENIMFVNNKSKIKLHYLVDDGPHNIEGFEGHGIVLDYPYNRDIKKPHTRIYSMFELIDFLKTEIQDKRMLHI